MNPSAGESGQCLTLQTPAGSDCPHLRGDHPVSATIVLPSAWLDSLLTLLSLLPPSKSTLHAAARRSPLPCESHPSTAPLSTPRRPQHRAKALTRPYPLLLPPCPRHSHFFAILERGSSFLPQDLCTGHTFSIYLLRSSPHLL